MRSRFTILLAIAAVCMTAAWAGLAPEEQISSNRYNNNLDQSCGHKVVVASNGVRHVVWAADGTIYYKRFYPASGWTPDTQLTTIKNSCVPSIALDSNGTDIHVVWAGDVAARKLTITRIYYMKCVPSSSGNGGWAGPPTALTPGVDSVMVYKSTAIASYRDRENVAHVGVTWFIDLQCCASPVPCVDTIGFRECVGGTWGSPVYFTFEAPGYTPTLLYPSIAVDAQGRYGDFFLVYQVLDPLYLIAVRRQGGVWQDPEYVASDTWLVDASIEVDPSTGYPHIVGCDLDIYHIWHTYWDPELGGWQVLEMVSDASAPDSRRPSMFYSGGSFIAAWAERNSEGVAGIRYSLGQYGDWSTPAWVASGYSHGRPSVTARSNGDVFVVWVDARTRRQQIWGRLYTQGGDGGGAMPIALPQSRVDLFPNPAKAGRVTVQYSLPREGQMAATLLDVSGRAVWRSESGVPSSKEGSFALDASGLHAGVYILKLESGTTSQTRKLVIQ